VGGGGGIKRECCEETPGGKKEGAELKDLEPYEFVQSPTHIEGEGYWAEGEEVERVGYTIQFDFLEKKRGRLEKKAVDQVAGKKKKKKKNKGEPLALNLFSYLKKKNCENGKRT